ncbi:TPA: PTS-dependent dihydroxyacetone kinase phosphotransferase subunit DhaM [Corynebacterium striatum]|uniref:dihydroxyacetone kinase phosphoryl donor subunit DhaM n=1 Tax=Corynebacterium striatum TaxID=43770 RepID=UPI0016620B7D|nr:dihydroxyacetone kinase phosphoryl donor subunit DhaM [Corynebacterium striatum]MBD0854362.1 PTS fructose transporter subunit IIA [Corynebacterium striatum]MDK7883312.1 dihydroxyacetone kinase phosphoryl donor subunit DhaM [Corynebacterium striatum]MDK8842754.1 dihydroxyacetone kinase phosphoryl donor subunit DhaM [Corynebacterium striatum]HCD2522813.1 PTS-dependent dihydroxyacetone kinase phosphotransferase subunit DhaM [Corynebacterium striatum]HCD3162490.1 PTS-dependent dihydroxyacetone 
MAEPKVGLVLVSHSAKLAEGLAELAGQMAADVRIAAAGGLESGEIGTSYDLIESAINDLLGEGLAVVVLTDLGSATMTVESVLEFLDDEPVKFVDAPLVEAAIAAATAAQQGDDLDAVAVAAERAIEVFVPKQAAEGKADVADGDAYSRSATVADAAGLHARPAAKVAEMAAEAAGDIVIAFDDDRADADSAMMLMSLGAAQGDTVTVSGQSVDKEIIDKIADAIAEGLDG